MATQGVVETGLDERLQVLAHSDRRRLLSALVEAEPGTDTPLRIGAIGDLDLDASVAELHHHHLPMLADHGFAIWHSDPLEVARGPQFDEIEPLIESLSGVHDGFAGLAP